ncbi:MAG: hypothetical protein ABI542_02985 [Gemmatimonadota bacterium]
MRNAMIGVFLLAVAGCSTDGVLGPGGTGLRAPASLTSTTLDNAIELMWSDDSYQSNPVNFRQYTVWSAGYDLDAGLCLEPWSVEGTTVAPRFVVSALANSVPRCFRVNGESVDGGVSAYSPIRFDTPRYGSEVLELRAAQVAPLFAGFTFWRDLDADQRATRNELGWVGGESDPTIDLALDLVGGELLLTPVRAGVRILAWPTLVSTLADIDLAPATGYARNSVTVTAGSGYVIEMDGPDGFRRYGAIRVIGQGANFIYFEFAFQGDPGNPELLRAECYADTQC